ncbi:hypothetical protein RD792_010512 [Penstemon davidsonii]|uniref:Uncharacterized protein n=1 Tax=Penstemon davidsonii TaxID=160366 RepID=A0ABR0D3K2_9LAMI|nr:hypothetical protein RD792_010512 [Penstemon davidsonii]
MKGKNPFNRDLAYMSTHDGNEIPESGAEAVSKTFAMMISFEPNIPSMIIESPTFKEFVGTLNPRFQPGTLKVLKADCFRFYKEQSIKISEVLNNLDGLISLSVQRLKCRAGNVYMCLNAHFIGDSWKRKKWVLSVWNVTRHSLSDSILKSLAYWKIEDKISSITLKDGAHFDETVEKIKDFFQTKKTSMLNGHFLSICCSTGLINSILQGVFDLIQDTMDKVFEFINHCHELDQMNSLDTSTKLGKKLPQWHLYYLMLKEAQELHGRCDFSSQNDLSHEYRLSIDEWKRVEVICKLVDMLQNLGKLFKDKYCNASIILCNVQELNTSLRKEAVNAGDILVCEIIARMVEKLDRYWAHTFLLLAVAAVMDPRCKMLYIEYLSVKFPNSKLSNVLEAVQILFDDYVARTPQNDDFDEDYDFEECEKDICRGQKDYHPNKKKVVKTEKSEVEGKCDKPVFKVPKPILKEEEKEDHPKKKMKVETPICEVEGNAKESEEISKTRVEEKMEEIAKGKVVNSHLDGYQELVQSIVQPPKSDLKRYLEEPVEAWSQELNLLEWWRDASPKYPVLSKMARDILSIPLSVVSWSDSYETEEHKLDSYLSSSGETLLNAFMCVRSWQKN